MVVWEYPPHVVGGLGTYSGAMAPALRAAGHDVQVFAALRDGDKPDPQPDTHWARQLDLSPTYLGVYNQEASSWGAFFGELYSTNILWADAVRTEHRRRPFDVIAVHDWLGAPAGLTLARHVDAPIVFHVHSAEWGRQPGGPSPIVSQWESAAGRSAAATITVSQAMVRDLIAHGWDADRVHGVWNGVDTEKFAPDAPGGADLRARYELADDAPVVFFIGRLTGVKGARPLIEGWPRVVDQHPEARLVALGTGDQDDEIRDWWGSWESRTRSRCGRNGFRKTSESRTLQPPTWSCCRRRTNRSGSCAWRRWRARSRWWLERGESLAFASRFSITGRTSAGCTLTGRIRQTFPGGSARRLSDCERMRSWGKNGRLRAVEMFTWERCAARTAEVYGRVG